MDVRGGQVDVRGGQVDFYALCLVFGKWSN